jgi:mRNA interferase HigB
MRVIKIKTLKDFWENINYKDSEQSLKSWYSSVKKELWDSTSDIKFKYRNASFLSNNRVVFNIYGNKYRLIVRINYTSKIVYIRFISTHKEYDKIDANEV